MGKRGKLRRKMEEDEDETPIKSVPQVSSSDDDEANEDLSLKIVEKSLLKRATKSTPDDFVFEDVNGDVDIAGGRGGILELDSLVPLVVEGDVGPGGTDNPVVVSEVEDGKSRRKSRKERKKSKMDSIHDDEKIEVVATEVEEVDGVKPINTVESVAPNAVEMPDNIVLRKLLRGPRYFDPPDSSWGTCFNCGEEGHTAVNCTMARRKKPCFVCGSLEHGVRNCTKGHDCFICKKAGHRAKDCPDKYKKSSQSSHICLKCGDSGHEMYSCRNDYCPDDLKAIQCYICKKYGHLCCVYSTESGSGDVSCYKCGQLGHTGLACNRIHGETTAAASPSLCYRCGEGGHFARECTSSAKTSKRNREFSTPAKRFSKEDKDYLGFQSAPNELGKARKKKKTRHEERGLTTPRKQKHRGGWSTEDPGESKKSEHKYLDGWSTEDLEDTRKSKRRGRWSTEDPGDSRKSKHRGGWSTEDPGDFSHVKLKRCNWTSPTGKSHKISASRSGLRKRTWKHQSENSPSNGLAKAYRHRYSASRFGNSNSQNSGTRRQYDWS